MSPSYEGPDGVCEVVDKNIDLVKAAWASSQGRKEPLMTSGLFNQGDPDLSSCVVPADDIIKTESDQFLTVDASELFPDLFGIEDSSNSKPAPVLDVLNLESVSNEKSDEEVSPAETEASLDHFFNTFTDLTGFLENISAETGPSVLVDDSAELAGSDNTTIDTYTAPSPCESADLSEDNDTVYEPPSKRSCQSTSEACTRTRQTYRERRDKNNVASRICRSKRKSKFQKMEDQAIALEDDNEHLKKKIEELQKIAELSRKCLVDALSNK